MRAWQVPQMSWQTAVPVYEARHGLFHGVVQVTALGTTVSQANKFSHELGTSGLDISRSPRDACLPAAWSVDGHHVLELNVMVIVVTGVLVLQNIKHPELKDDLAVESCHKQLLNCADWQRGFLSFSDWFHCGPPRPVSWSYRWFQAGRTTSSKHGQLEP